MISQAESEALAATGATVQFLILDARGRDQADDSNGEPKA